MTAVSATPNASPARTTLIAVRLIFGLLTLAAVVAQLRVHIRFGFNIVNFFSYFTNIANIFASFVFLAGASALAAAKQPTRSDEMIRGTAAVCMALVGVVFSILLRNEDLGQLLPWVNIIVHYLMPIVVVAEWLAHPPKATLELRDIGYWLVLPVAYSLYTIIRGAATGFYPYPFFNPAKVGGYGGVALYCAGILVAFLAMSWLIMTLGNRLGRRIAAPA